ncbi:MAG: double-strand break repair helicase AddA [Silicimonas sp.]|nr:double-strand break repair helicase AddA [Silicimonas sp.]
MRNAATEAQVIAADPQSSTWLSANAGSGKTRVLTNRVARLLLQGTAPRNILCLTYTKAAASEMQNRLFQTLGDWAMRSDDELRAALEDLGEVAPKDLGQARTLFARAIEVPGGLRIQTIHALCSAILRQFPLEGGVSPQFSELDERGQEALIGDVLDGLAESHGAVLSEMSRFHADDTLVGLARMIASKADDFVITNSRNAIFDAFGVSGNLTIPAILEAAIGPGDLMMLRDLAQALRGSDKVTDLKTADKFAALPKAASMKVLVALEGILLTGGTAKIPYGAKIGSLPTKGAQKLPAVAAHMEALEALMRRIEDGRRDRIAFGAASKTDALHRFAEAFLPRYEAAKQARGVLDFDDLIRRTRDMLTGPALKWVLYRLDGQIDHILVDEAQDTSPAQWQIIRALTEAMVEDDARLRTLFVVGDKKQSIYSFQGADTREFDRKAVEFDAQLAGRLKGRELLHSFRSSPAILSLVDKVCDRVAGLGGRVVHHGFFRDKPGRVDLLPLVQPPEEAEELPWYDPVDRPVENAASVVLARQVAQTIKRLLETETISGEKGQIRRISAGDIMILVQRRSAIFDQIIQECKAAGLPVAGSDRLKIGAELAVRDLLALMSFLTLPEDDLSLAASLRSPLFGMSEAGLFDLAAKREGRGSLWLEMLRRETDFPDSVPVLQSLLARADFLRPYELLEFILGEIGGREKLLARLGAEAEDGIDELLNQALGYERDEVPSLTGFLARVRSEDIEVKRDASGSDDLIRVMTVHGAKGLERPVVILPDTTAEGRDRGSGLLVGEDGLPVMSGSKDESPEQILALKSAKAQEDREERNRLLYVAMTRAESWLIVAGAALKRASKTDMNWHQSIEAGMLASGAGPSPLDPEGLRLEHGEWPTPMEPCVITNDIVVVRAPDFLTEPAVPPEKPEAPLTPSALDGAKVMGGGAMDEEAAKRRGRQVHLLLEHLPGQADPQGMAQKLLARGPDRAEPAEINALSTLVQDTIAAHPAIFAEEALAEVDITAHLASRGQDMVGIIDRLIVTPDRVTAVDFKTNAIVPNHPEETPKGILAQMGAYLEALEAIYPEREIELAVLWTETQCLMTLPHGIVRQAFAPPPIS